MNLQEQFRLASGRLGARTAGEYDAAVRPFFKWLPDREYDPNDTESMHTLFMEYARDIEESLRVQNDKLF